MKKKTVVQRGNKINIEAFITDALLTTYYNIFQMHGAFEGIVY